VADRIRRRLPFGERGNLVARALQREARGACGGLLGAEGLSQPPQLQAKPAGAVRALVARP
jgi:hypothetical protein